MKSGTQEIRKKMPRPKRQPHPLQDKLIARVKRIAEEKGYSQAHLADAFGMFGYQQWQKHLAGRALDYDRGKKIEEWCEQEERG